MGWINDVQRAVSVIKKGKYVAVTHGGMAHMDDTLAAALLHRHGAEAIYRHNKPEEILTVEGDVVVFDIGDSFRDKLPERYVVLDHHGVADPAEEPSSVIQVALAVDAKLRPLQAHLIHYVDLFDRYGPAVKRWAGPYGNSLNYALTKYFADGAPAGRVKDAKFLDLLADAVYSAFEADLPAFAEAFRIAEKLPFVELAEKFPRTFHTLKLMLEAAKDPVAVSTSRSAFEVGFGIDFGAYAVMAVPELEPYVLKGLEKHYSEAKKAAEAAAAGRYAVIKGSVTAVAVEDSVSPSFLWVALQDLGVLTAAEPAFVVVKDLRTPGAYTLWRPDRHANAVDFRRLQGPEVVFKHATGFLAVVKAESAEAAARLALARLY